MLNINGSNSVVFIVCIICLIINIVNVGESVVISVLVIEKFIVVKNKFCVVNYCKSNFEIGINILSVSK